MSDTVEVEITQMPDGPAPESVRKAWVGVRFPAKLLPGDVIERDFTQGKPMGNRGGIMVETDIAINRLSEKSKDAADWFRQNVPPGMPFLSFGPTEFEVV